VNNIINELTDMILFYTTYRQNPWLRFKLWPEIDTIGPIIKWI
jgi:hypothetical protein